MVVYHLKENLIDAVEHKILIILRVVAEEISRSIKGWLKKLKRWLWLQIKFIPVQSTRLQDRSYIQEQYIPLLCPHAVFEEIALFWRIEVIPIFELDPQGFYQ